jgi:hypothetical protein
MLMLYPQQKGRDSLRNFSWSCFQVTGSIDAYLLYKDVEALTLDPDDKQLEDKEQNEEAK